VGKRTVQGTTLPDVTLQESHEKIAGQPKSLPGRRQRPAVPCQHAPGRGVRIAEYVGPWLPEPVIDTAALAPDSRTIPSDWIDWRNRWEYGQRYVPA
jgi:hypothetical protein